MSVNVDLWLAQENSRPTRRGSRRRPRGREAELVRPSMVYRYALETSLWRMSVIEKLREDGFNPS